MGNIALPGKRDRSPSLHDATHRGNFIGICNERVLYRSLRLIEGSESRSNRDWGGYRIGGVFGIPKEKTG